MAEYNRVKKNTENELKHYIKAKEIYLSNKSKAFEQENNYFYNLLPKFIKRFKDTNLYFNEKIKPIFIMGLPRSGTTLVENIIYSGVQEIKSSEEAGIFWKSF